ncbi:hypothetical protein ACIBJF_33035 [Streptomyces sp. NPDC050743]|uniref:hypothetical protein n=1 Tax=Streptomyces sp. NPDC050743 TaxID=3365634 RepID=UPI0037990B8F
MSADTPRRADEGLLAVRGVGEQMRLRGLTGWDQLTDRHLEAYRDHVLTATIPAQRKRALQGAVLLLHSYRDLLPAPCRMATADPWRGARDDALVVVPGPGRVNKTPRIALAMMEALLAWSLRMLEDIGPDVAEARRVWQGLRAGEYRSQAGFDGLPIRDRLARFLAAAGADAVLPGRRGADGGLVLDEYALCRLLGLDSSHGKLRSDLQRRMAAASGLPIADGCPLPAPITGRIDGRPWRESPITAGELPGLVQVLTAALFTVVCHLSGMRPGEVLNLRRGCRATDPGDLLLGRRDKAPGLWTSCRAAGTRPGLGRPVRCGDGLSLPDGRRQFAR